MGVADMDRSISVGSSYCASEYHGVGSDALIVGDGSALGIIGAGIVTGVLMKFTGASA